MLHRQPDREQRIEARVAEMEEACRLEPERQQVVVGPKSALAVTAARLSEPSWLEAIEDRPLLAKVRSLAKPVPARLDGEWLRFDVPEFGVAPGQAAVLYDAEKMLGGGWIEQTIGVVASPLVVSEQAA